METQLETVRLAQQAQFRAVVDYDSFVDLLPSMVQADAKNKPSFFAMFQMLSLWTVTAPDLIFTVGGMQAAMPTDVKIGDVLNAILGDATGTFFDRRAKNRASLVVTQQCVAILLQQLRSPLWTATEMNSDDAMGLA